MDKDKKGTEKYKVGRLNRGLREIASDAGYTPGEFSMRRFAEDVQTVTRWMELVDAGTIPPEFLGWSPGDIRERIRLEMKDIGERERAWMEFFYPKLKSQESSLSVTGELSLLDLLKRGTTTDSD